MDEVFLRESHLTTRDRAFIKHLVQGVFRWRLRLDWIIEQASDLPFKKIKPPVLNILRLALFQVFFLDRVPDSAAVNEAVKQAKGGGARHAAPFINGILRHICRHKEKFSLPDRDKDPALYLSVFYSYPRWLVQYCLEKWGTPFTEALLDAENQLPKLTLRTNTLRISRDALLGELQDAGIMGRPTPYSPEGILLPDFRGTVMDLEAFQKGFFQVQDQAAQITTHLLAPRAGESILDVCAGLGGKTSHLAQLIGDEGHVVALDVSRDRLVKLRANSGRLGLARTEPVAADAMGGLGSLFKATFDRILVDAPCSGLGVLSKHPDGKWNKEAEDLVRLSRVQKKILEQGLSLLTRGGHLLYVTCTLTEEENEGLVRGIVEDNQDIGLLDLREHGPEWAWDLIDGEGFFRTYPHRHQMDGFFAALFVKK